MSETQVSDDDRFEHRLARDRAESQREDELLAAVLAERKACAEVARKCRTGRIAAHQILQRGQ